MQVDVEVNKKSLKIKWHNGNIWIQLLKSQEIGIPNLPQIEHIETSLCQLLLVSLTVIERDYWIRFLDLKKCSMLDLVLSYTCSFPLQLEYDTQW